MACVICGNDKSPFDNEKICASCLKYLRRKLGAEDTEKDIAGIKKDIVSIKKDVERLKSANLGPRRGI